MEISKHLDLNHKWSIFDVLNNRRKAQSKIKWQQENPSHSTHIQLAKA